MKYDYGFFLFSQLAFANERIGVELDYDIAFADAISLYEDFLASSYNDKDNDLYDCIEEYFIQTN